MWGFIVCVAFFYCLYVQLKFPEGRTENKTAGPRAPWSVMSQFWDATGFSPLNLEVQDKAGHKSHERRGGTRFRREKERCLCCCCTSTYTRIPNQTFTPHHGSCPLSLDIYPFPRGNLCTDERKWVPCRESTSMSHGLEFV